MCSGGAPALSNDAPHDFSWLESLAVRNVDLPWEEMFIGAGSTTAVAARFV
jgi:hypothetical protein